MPIWQAVVLGVVQGLGEFLPISSSAHLILVPWLMGWEDPGLAFDVALHWGTLVAVLAVFWRDWINLISAGLRSLRDRRLAGDTEAGLFWALLLASVPGAIAGKLLAHRAEELRSPLLIAVTMAVMGVVLWLTDRLGSKTRPMEQMGLGEALGIGVAQSLALIPGVSRSGSTISLGLAFGFERGAIARFSFLMSTPIIFGAGLLKFPALFHALRGEGPEAALVTPASLLAGMAAAAIVGTLVIRWLLQYLRNHGYGIFALYRGLVAVAIVALWLSGKR